MLRNLGETIATLLPTVPETEAHPHAPEERGELFTALSGGAVELEALTFLNALVYLYKPRLALETGTGSGYSAAAIASAMRANGFGTLHTVELDPAVCAQARANVRALDPGLLGHIRFVAGESLPFIDAWPGDPFDFAFFDSLVAFRHVELERLQEQGLLADGAVCVFHDTSRRRGERMGDFNPEMIAALDRHAAGGDRLESPFSRGLRVIRLPARAPVRRVAAPGARTKTFRHSGKLGDVVYALPAIRALGGGTLLLNADGRFGMGPDEAEALLPLLRAQPYLARADLWRGEPVEVDLDAFRGRNPGGNNLADCHLDAFGLRRGERDVAWLRVDGAPGTSPKVVFARSRARKGMPGFWEECYRRMGGEAAFVGSADEHRAFCQEVGDVPRLETPDLLRAARAIAAADIFVGNQSAPLAIAEGLKRPTVVEVDPEAPNCLFTRANALAVRSLNDLARVGPLVENRFAPH